MLSITEKILVAALELENRGKRPFTAEDLVVSAWQTFPDAFGLAGYRDRNGIMMYPDSNRVFAEIMGSKPVRKKGYLVKVGSKMYQLTESGHEYAKCLLKKPGDKQVEKASLSRDIEKELKRLFESRALAKFSENRITDLTFFDLCDFFGISPRSSAIELFGRISNFERILSSAKEVAQEKKVSFIHGGLEFRLADLNTLMKLKEELLFKFENDLNIIRMRTDERSK
jgi:hypothetical protein